MKFLSCPHNASNSSFIWVSYQCEKSALQINWPTVQVFVGQGKFKESVQNPPSRLQTMSFLCQTCAFLEISVPSKSEIEYGIYFTQIESDEPILSCEINPSANFLGLISDSKPSWCMDPGYELRKREHRTLSRQFPLKLPYLNGTQANSSFARPLIMWQRLWNQFYVSSPRRLRMMSFPIFSRMANEYFGDKVW